MFNRESVQYLRTISTHRSNGSHASIYQIDQALLDELNQIAYKLGYHHGSVDSLVTLLTMIANKYLIVENYQQKQRQEMLNDENNYEIPSSFVTKVLNSSSYLSSVSDDLLMLDDKDQILNLLDEISSGKIYLTKSVSVLDETVTINKNFVKDLLMSSSYLDSAEEESLYLSTDNQFFLFLRNVVEDKYIFHERDLITEYRQIIDQHKKELKKAEKEIKRLQDQISNIPSGLYINEMSIDLAKENPVSVTDDLYLINKTEYLGIKTKHDTLVNATAPSEEPKTFYIDDIEDDLKSFAQYFIGTERYSTAKKFLDLLSEMKRGVIN